jgi:hypothetical protein
VFIDLNISSFFWYGRLAFSLLSKFWYDEIWKKKFEGVIRICKSKDSQKDKPQSTKHIHKTKDRVTRTSRKTGGKFRCSRRVCSSCSTSGTRRVNLVTNPVVSHAWGNDREVFTTSGTYSWSFVTQKFHNGQLSHGGDRKTFEVMTSTSLIGTLDTVSSLLAALRYQWKPDRNHKLWKIVSTDIYSIWRCCWNVATYKWKVHKDHKGEIKIISLVVKFRS